MPDTERLAALTGGEQIEFAFNDKPKCPHCGDLYDVEANEAWELYDDNDSHDIDCTGCGLEFSVSTLTSYSFSTDAQESD
jgi:hypothetical protein